MLPTKSGKGIGMLRRILAVLFALLLAVPAQAQRSDAGFTARLHRIAVQLGVPGFSVAVVQDGKIVYRHQEGVTDRTSGAAVAPDSLFAIASVTKSMTGIILAQLEREEFDRKLALIARMNETR
ncbi:MAG: serine hydrolase domain-containing protein [Pseudomonadota bacterium]